MFCDTRYLLYWIAIKVLCFCLISSIVLMCGFYFNMPSGSDCAVRLGRSRSARLITKSVFTGVSEWVSDTFAYPSPHNKPVSTLRVSTSLKRHAGWFRCRQSTGTFHQVLPSFIGWIYFNNGIYLSKTHLSFCTLSRSVVSSEWMFVTVVWYINRYLEKKGFKKSFTKFLSLSFKCLTNHWELGITLFGNSEQFKLSLVCNLYSEKFMCAFVINFSVV